MNWRKIRVRGIYHGHLKKLLPQHLLSQRLKPFLLLNYKIFIHVNRMAHSMMATIKTATRNIHFQPTFLCKKEISMFIRPPGWPCVVSLCPPNLTVKSADFHQTLCTDSAIHGHPDTITLNSTWRIITTCYTCKTVRWEESWCNAILWPHMMNSKRTWKKYNSH